MQAYRKKLGELKIPHLVRLSNDAWGLVLIIIMLSFLQYAVGEIFDMADLLQYGLTVTLITILIIAFFSNPDRETSKFVSSNIMFFAFFIALLTIDVEWDILVLLVGFLALLWAYFFLCMEFVEIEEYEINVFHLFITAVIQLFLYSLTAVAFLGLPKLS